MDYDILPTEEFSTFEGRRYINPTLPVTETNQFIDNLRQTQQANNQQVNTQTQRLGTNVSSNLGGLTGGEGYWTSRYQTPQTNSAVANLRATAQATALNEALANEKAMWDKRYQEAYRAYQKRQNDKTNSGGGGDDDAEDDVELTDSSKTVIGTTPGVSGGYTVANIDTDTGEVLGYTGVPYGEEGVTNYTVSLSDIQSTPTRQKMPSGVSGNNTSYLYPLPNGHTVMVNEAKYDLVQKDGGYVLRDKSTGAEFPVGG